MTLTEEAYRILDKLDEIVRNIAGFPQLEKQLAESLQVDRCIVVMGIANSLNGINPNLLGHVLTV